MSKKVYYEIRIISSKKDEDYSATKKQRSGMPMITCECGAEILLVPDINAMNNAIENHIDKHRKAISGTEQESLSPIHIRQVLVEQILQKASEILQT